jgi:hypothetical protein
LHALPVEVVIPSLRGIVVNDSASMITECRFDDVLERAVFQIRTLDGLVEVIDIGFVMLTVMKADGLT